MMPGIYEIWDIIKISFNDFLGVQWNTVHFRRESFAVWAAIILIAAVFLRVAIKLIRRKNHSFFEHSGYLFERSDKPGIFFRTLSNSSGAFAIVGVILLLLAIADPYIIRSQQVEFTKYREYIIVYDASVSSGFRFRSSNRTRAHVARDFLLKLVAGRRGKNDRAGDVIFATDPYVISGFTNDTNSLIFSIASSPLGIADPETPNLEYLKGLFVIKEFEAIPYGGHTDLYKGLYSAIGLFDEHGDKQITQDIEDDPTTKRRSVVIITDGASRTDPEPQFKELRKRHIVPYLIFLDPDKEAERGVHGDNSPNVRLPDELLKMVKRYGGDYFMATSEFSLDKISKKLDELHAIRTGVKKYTVEERIYRKPLSISLFMFFIAIFLRFALWWTHRVV